LDRRAGPDSSSSNFDRRQNSTGKNIRDASNESRGSGKSTTAMTNNTARTGNKSKSRRIILRGENEDMGQLKAIFEKGVGTKSTSRNAGNGMINTVSNFRRKKGLSPDRPQIEVARPMTHFG
jgi:hypothetical protein